MNLPCHLPRDRRETISDSTMVTILGRVSGQNSCVSFVLTILRCHSSTSNPSKRSAENQLVHVPCQSTGKRANSKDRVCEEKDSLAAKYIA